MSAKHFATCPGPSFIYGAVPVEPVVKAQRKERPKKDVIEKERKVEKLEEEEDPEVIAMLVLWSSSNLFRLSAKQQQHRLIRWINKYIR